MHEPEDVFIDVEQDPTRIEQLFEQYGLPIPPHQPGDWVGVNLETHQPVTIPHISDYDPLTLPATPSGDPKETP